MRSARPCGPSASCSSATALARAGGWRNGGWGASASSWVLRSRSQAWSSGCGAVGERTLMRRGRAADTRRYIPLSFHRGAVTATLRDQLQAALGQAYVLDRELGGGGMSRVFVAHEHGARAGRSSSRSCRRARRRRQRRSVPAGDPARRAAPAPAHRAPALRRRGRGLPYFIMPFVTGESLRGGRASGELPVPETVRILRDVASALAYAHTRRRASRHQARQRADLRRRRGGHRFRRGQGGQRHPEATTSVTSLGVALGTPAYMAPEQATAIRRPITAPTSTRSASWPTRC